ncbi:DNA ligase [Sinanaerobacter sp. ZZT-01]|uniref:ATP-dependent DNA ligase n=1 Tax=Sinanaerobacter sp. ZZT-01 TaxID=3111540 RepID=UPI002D788E3E|nr:DNA ligase [Sinanaerobacter sp. ZZT-01]WRR94582.1 DNA ligase [Sinanaerobacter sp. ZZT-01]
MDIFKSKIVKPMLIGMEGEPFDNKSYIFELKLDGERCIAYLDENGTELRNKRNMKMLRKVPELSQIHKQVKCRCILDGELIIIKDGVPDFSEIKKRSLMSNTFKIEMESKKLPATFTAYDIIYYKDKQVTNMPLMDRKLLLGKIAKESERLAISRYIEEKGIALFDLAKQKELEGIVAKLKDSKYYLDKRTKDWIKIKYLKDDDFVICGYIEKSDYIVSLILGQYSKEELIDKGHVTLGVSKESFSKIASHKKTSNPPFTEQAAQSRNKNAVWLSPDLVCTVKYMEKTSSGSLRQPVFKGLREDKQAKECISCM